MVFNRHSCPQERKNYPHFANGTRISKTKLDTGTDTEAHKDIHRQSDTDNDRQRLDRKEKIGIPSISKTKLGFLTGGLARNQQERKQSLKLKGGRGNKHHGIEILVAKAGGKTTTPNGGF